MELCLSSFLDWICFMNPMYFITLNSQIGSPKYFIEMMHQ